MRRRRLKAREPDFVSIEGKTFCWEDRICSCRRTDLHLPGGLRDAKEDSQLGWGQGTGLSGLYGLSPLDILDQ